MSQTNSIREIGDFQYYIGSHPKMRSRLRSSSRPTEFGNKVWASSLVLINYLQENPFELKGLRVLEIGCGWGLLGVYLAKLHHCHVTCTDMDEKVLPIVQLHAELNEVTIKTKKASFGELKESFLNNFDLIIGAEVCYSEEVGLEITAMVQRAFKGNVKQVLIADPGRPDFYDYQTHCAKHNKTKLIELPGSVNGKSTKLLSVFK
jgi:predicted nicotinamide N-methyase